jgi:hypothetical protein
MSTIWLCSRYIVPQPGNKKNIKMFTIKKKIKQKEKEKEREREREE